VGPPRRVVLLDDDGLVIRAVARALRSAGLEVEGALDATEALALVEQAPVHAVVSDLHMPGACGAQFLAAVAEKAPDALRLLMSADPAFRPERGTLAAARVHALMNKSVLPGLAPLLVQQLIGRFETPGTSADREGLARRVAHALARPGHEDDGHRDRLVDRTARICEALGLSAEEIASARLGAILHDVGQITVPEHVFGRPAPLGETAREALERHPGAGERIVEPMPALRDALPIIRAHHERMDGTGYPSRLEAAAIPRSARAFQVADSYDALTQGRAYRPRVTHRDALAELLAQTERQLDPEAVGAFASLAEEVLPTA